MRQLTSLDAQFLALENDRTHGHVGSLAIYDPSTAPGGTLTVADLRALLRERLHLLTPFRWRLVEVPVQPGPSVLGRAGGRRPRVPRARDRPSRAREPAAARRAGRADLRAAPGPQPPALGDVPDPRGGERDEGRPAHEGPPRRSRRSLRRGDPRHADGPCADRPRDRAAGARAARRSCAQPVRAARPRAHRHAAPHGARAALAPGHAPEPRPRADAAQRARGEPRVRHGPPRRGARARAPATTS